MFKKNILYVFLILICFSIIFVANKEVELSEYNKLNNLKELLTNSQNSEEKNIYYSQEYKISYDAYKNKDQTDFILNEIKKISEDGYISIWELCNFRFVIDNDDSYRIKQKLIKKLKE